jgi:cytochrome b561
MICGVGGFDSLHFSRSLIIKGKIIMDYNPRSPSGYSVTQIILHWVIVGLIAFQIVFGESMEAALDAFEEGGTLSNTYVFLSNLHIYFGIAVLVLAVVRLAVRLGTGAPLPPAGTSVLQVRLAALVHIAFYILLFAVPISGLVTWYIEPEVGDFHALAKPAFLVLIGLHVAGALYHQFIVRDGVLTRIFVPRS